MSKGRKGRTKQAPREKVRSGLERRVLDNLIERGVEYAYESEKFGLLLDVTGHLCSSCGGKKVRRRTFYTPDIKLLRSGIVVEVKGKFTARNRKVALAMREQYPDVDLRLLFMRDNTFSKRSTTRYSDWCEENEFEYDVGEVIPEDWI